MDNDLYNKVDEILKKDVKHLVEADGGRIKLHSVEGNKVYVEMFGACKHCAAIQYTLKGSVEKILKMKIPEISSVELRK